MDLDLSEYFARVGLTGAPRADLAGLAALQAAHAAAIPFANLDILRGLPIRLELAAIADKLVTRRGAGYCFEQNTLMAAALERLGFAVTRLIGRVRSGRPPEAPPTARTHMILEVDVDGAAHLVDVGFGSHQPLAPIPIGDAVEVAQHAWRFALARVGETYTLRTRVPEGWSDMYTFTREPQHAIDFEVANHWTSTHPSSHFVTGLTVQRVTPEARRTVRGREFELQRADERVRRTLASRAELAEVMAAEFGLELTPDVRVPAFA